MRVLFLEMTLHIPWAQSLKDKRSVVKSLVAKLRQKFNASAAEAARQDAHKTAVLAVAALVFDAAQADATEQNITRFVQGNTDAELVRVEKELM